MDIFSSKKVFIKKLSPFGKVPTQGTDYSAGYDLYAAENSLVFKLSRTLVKTNISISIPDGYYGRIAPRSGLANKYGIDIMAGVIDSDYRGDVGVILFNSDKYNDFPVKIGDRIAQIIIEKCHKVVWSESENLSDSSRSESGYGSTGV